MRCPKCYKDDMISEQCWVLRRHDAEWVEIPGMGKVIQYGETKILGDTSIADEHNQWYCRRCDREFNEADEPVHEMVSSVIDSSGEVKHVKVAIVNLGEGRFGDYEEDNPDDINFLRFDVYLFDETTKLWEIDSNGSCCTSLPATVPMKTVKLFAERVLSTTLSAIKEDLSLKLELGRLTWLDEEDLYETKEDK